MWAVTNGSYLTDRVVIVTGAARGLGKQVAKSFYDNGAK
jgi:NAD(P)-dependent dehydrogenase (short-subunit alcohol dehydrogenase family)